MLEFTLSQWLRVCLISGVFAALLLNIPMYVQSEGYLPAFVAAGGLTRADPATVHWALAVIVHHVAGIAAALLYGTIVYVLSLVLPTLLSLNGVPALPHILGAVGVTLVLYVFFDRIAMPRAGGSLRDDAETILEQWALTAFIFGTTLGLFVPVGVTLL